MIGHIEAETKGPDKPSIVSGPNTGMPGAL